MIVTEKQASEKWCPMIPKNGSENRDLTASCIGSRCMAWRILEDDTPTQMFDPRGFCGLAYAVRLPWPT